MLLLLDPTLPTMHVAVMAFSLLYICCILAYYWIAHCIIYPTIPPSFLYTIAFDEIQFICIYLPCGINDKNGMP